MVILRATQKVLRLLPETAGDAKSSDTALGDWYLNRIIVDRQPLILLVSSKSRLSMLAPARDLKSLPSRVGEMLFIRLRRLGIDSHLVRAEVEAMDIALVGRTRDRSVTGQLVDFARAIPYYIPVGTAADSASLRHAEDRLAHTPCLCGRSATEAVWPDRDTGRLLAEHWSKPKTVH